MLAYLTNDIKENCRYVYTCLSFHRTYILNSSDNSSDFQFTWCLWLPQNIYSKFNYFLDDRKRSTLSCSCAVHKNLVVDIKFGGQRTCLLVSNLWLQWRSIYILSLVIVTSILAYLSEDLSLRRSIIVGNWSVSIKFKLRTDYHSPIFMGMAPFKYFCGYLMSNPAPILTEYMSGGSLHDFLHKVNNVLELPLILKFALDVCQGMNYLHQNNIIHRDLKTANLLMDKNHVCCSSVVENIHLV